MSRKVLQLALVLFCSVCCSKSSKFTYLVCNFSLPESIMETCTLALIFKSKKRKDRKNDEKRRNGGRSRTQEIEREETEETTKRCLRGVIWGRKFPPSDISIITEIWFINVVIFIYCIYSALKPQTRFCVNNSREHLSFYIC